MQFRKSSIRCSPCAELFCAFFTNSKRSIHSNSPLCSLLSGALLTLPLFAADPELTNWKSGISLNFGDSATTAADKGVAYAEEYLYFDKIVDDHKVVYVKSDTPITMSQNAINVASSGNGYSIVGPGHGTMKYKIDGDQYRLPLPANWTTYNAPFSFDDLNYGLYGASGTPVVGTTGATGGALTFENRNSRYCRGMLDSVGDEWHILTAADDDTALGANPEWRASDGKIWHFVVNPKTPCATWRVSGSGQFYTTPPKKYFFPIIYDQTTYFTGTVTCELRDINGNNVFYRINGGSFIDAGANHVTLDQDDFTTGSNTLEYYYAGNAAYTKTRTVVKNPGFPSAGEAHGDRLWVSAALFESEVKPRITADESLNSVRNYWKTDYFWNKANTIASSTRLGRRPEHSLYPESIITEASFANAFTARWEGMNFVNGGTGYTTAKLAKLSLFETKTMLDPIGYEHPAWPGVALPSREMNYRGYTDVDGIYAHAGTYDILAGYYRTDQGFAEGLSPIEDYFIRDALAKWVHNAQLVKAGYTAAGFWPSAHVTGAMVIAGMMPAYSTSYFGTCGLDGNITTYAWTPCPDTSTNYTWKQLFFSGNLPVTGYPEIANNAQSSDLFLSDGKWSDRIPYIHTSLYGKCLQVEYNMIKLFNPAVNLPKVDAAMALAASGQLYGNKFTEPGDSGPHFMAWAGLQNSWFPSFRDVAQPTMLALTWPDINSLGKQINDASSSFSIIHYNHNLQKGKEPPVAPTNVVFPRPSR